jgi:glycyl-tRNA synthetase beta chain
VALADRLDSLVGCFAVGLVPTGTADPFALRRACIATLRTLIESAARNPAFGSIELRLLFGRAYDGFAGKKLDLSREETVAKLREFTLERLRGLVAAQTSGAVADAVTAGGDLERPAHVVARARALHEAVTAGQAWIAQARTVAKRLGGISKEFKAVSHGKDAFEKPEDHAIVDVIATLDDSTKNLSGEAAVSAALAGAEGLAARLDEVFTKTLVNDPADPRTPKRLELLSYGAQCMLRIGDFSRLSAVTA